MVRAVEDALEAAAGDGGKPLVAADPTSPTAQAFLELGAAVVREVAKLRRAPQNSVRWDAELGVVVVRLPGDGPEGEFCLDAATVRRNDTSAASINEWTGERTSRDADVPDDVEPATISPVGNYAAQIAWQDGFNQVAPYELLAELPRLGGEEVEARRRRRAATGGPSAAQQILAGARPLQ